MSPLASYVVETLVTLLGVIALAILVLYAARRLGVGRPAGPLALVGKLPLDGRRSIYLVRVGKSVLVVGASEAGLSKLGEIAEGEIDLSDAPAEKSAFAAVLARAMSRQKPAGAAEKEEAS